MRKSCLLASGILAMGIMLSGCGFHLQDEVSLAEAVPELKVTGDWHHPFYRKVVDRLRVSGVKVGTKGYGDDGVDMNDASIPELTVPAPTISNPVTSLNIYMSSLESNLIVSTANILNIPGHRPLQMKNSLTRSYLNKTGKALATSNEYQIVLDETYDELASQLVTRISYLGRQSDPDSKVMTPAELTESNDDPSTKVQEEVVPEGMTLMEALKAKNAQEAAEGKRTELSELNNGAAILEHNYELPKTKPVLKNEAPDTISEENF